MKRLLLSFFGLIAAYIFVYPMTLWMLGYYPGAPGWEVGRMAASRGDVKLCEKIINLPWGIFSMGPSVAEAQFLCIHEYASLTKDPSACELLMPSSYGWDCLGAAEESNARICWFDFSKERYSNSKPVMPECGGKNDSSARRCCEMAKFLYVEKELNCNEFNDSAPLHDQCLELVARRERDIHTCSQIQSDHIRTTCEVAVRALKKD